MVLPKSFNDLDQEEMMYLDGGNGWYNSVTNVSRAIDAAIIFIPGAAAIKSGATLAKLLRTNAGQELTRTLRSQIIKFGGTAGSAIFANVLNFAITLASGSIGTLIATGIDRFDSKPRNGYCFG